MSLRTDRLRSRPSHPMSDKHVNTGSVEHFARSTSSQPSYARPGQWIRRQTRRYTQQGATFPNLNHVPPTASVPPTAKSTRVIPTALRHIHIPHRLQKKPPQVRRATPRQTERPDVCVRRQQATNPSPIDPGLVSPTHATPHEPNPSSYL
jgi:hypothetical protein